MNALDVLKNEYPGDAAWQQFVEIFRPAWLQWPEKETYLARLGGEEFAAVLTASLGTHAYDWFQSPCGALDKRSPIDVFRTEPDGIRILRTLLMRLPR